MIVGPQGAKGNGKRSFTTTNKSGAKATSTKAVLLRLEEPSAYYHPGTGAPIRSDVVNGKRRRND